MNTAVKKLLVVYDGDCSFCRGQVARIQRMDPGDQFEYRPRQEAGLQQEYPQLAQHASQDGLRVILPDGRVQIGADAVYQINRLLPYFRHVAFVYHIPGLHALFKFVYSMVSRNRQRISRIYCKDGSCAVQKGKESV